MSYDGWYVKSQQLYEINSWSVVSKIYAQSMCMFLIYQQPVALEKTALSNKQVKTYH